MAALIGFLLGEFEFEFFVLGLICAVASILRGRRPAGERLLAFYVLFSIGALNFVNFIYHVFFGEMSARFIGWPDSPFQTELGFASLGFALVGFLAWRGSYGMRVAAVHLSDHDHRQSRGREFWPPALDGLRHSGCRPALFGNREAAGDAIAGRSAGRGSNAVEQSPSPAGGDRYARGRRCAVKP
jgi:hypothetical protein